MNIWFEIKGDVAKKLNVDVSHVEESDQEGFGDFAFPCFALAKQKRMSPADIASSMAQQLKVDHVKEIKAVGPYINFYIDWQKVLPKVIEDVNEKYGSSKEGAKKKVIIDLSAPNIAKPMSVGHLRSTIIGNSLCRIYGFLGYDVISDNHLGDWGTQFGKLLAAYKLWGSKKEVEEDPIKSLLRLYVKFHQDAEKDATLEDLGREWFKKLEDGNKEAVTLWKWFKKESLKDFNKIYKQLGVKFDTARGESFYNNMTRGIIEDALKANVAKRNPDGSIVIDLSRFNLTDLLIQKTDGATLYATRDLATLKHRAEEYKFYKNIYVVGSEQKLHFSQFIRAGELLGYSPSEKSVHVDFGMVSLPEGKMSTRKGNVIFLEELISKAVMLAQKLIEEKNPKLAGKEKIAKKVAIAAIIFNDLSTDRTNNILFDWNRMMSFEGRSGPYIQYTYARASSILRKAKAKPTTKNLKLLEGKVEKEIAKLLAKYPSIVEKSATEYKPSHLAIYMFELANKFNEFYQSNPVLKAESKQLVDARLKLTESVKTVLKSGLYLLGIEAPEKM